MPPEQARQWLQDQQPADDEDALQAAEDEQGQPAPQEGAQPGAPLWVWPENLPVFDLFMGLQTQWHLSPSGHPVALRYEAADVLLRRFKTKRPNRTFRQLQEMERAALHALQEKTPE